MKHWDILLSNQVDKKTFINTLLSGEIQGELSVFNSLNGILYSDISIQKLIEEEYQYDSIEATTESHRNLTHLFIWRAKKGIFKVLPQKKS